VRILQTASMIRLLESLYAESFLSENPYINLTYNKPPINTSGDNPNDTNVNDQLATNAIVIPHNNELKFIKLIPIVVEVRLLINLASTDNRDVRVPALFLGSSKYDIGILINFLNVSYRTYSVNFSATIVKHDIYTVQHIKAA